MPAWGFSTFYGTGSGKNPAWIPNLNTLADKTLRIAHPWMKENQYLTDILVPIYFQVKQMAQREELETFLARYRQPGT